LYAQLTRDLFAIAKFLFSNVLTNKPDYKHNYKHRNKHWQQKQYVAGFSTGQGNNHSDENMKSDDVTMFTCPDEKPVQILHYSLYKHQRV